MTLRSPRIPVYQPTPSTPTVLLVEDQSDWLFIVTTWLERAGFRVLSSSSGAEALGRWREEGAEVDLLLTDIDLGKGLNGVELAASLQAQRQDLKVIYMSGSGFDLLGPGRETRNCLKKPFSRTSLTCSATEAIAAEAA